MNPAITSLRKLEEVYATVAVMLRDAHKELGYVPGATVHAKSQFLEIKYPSGDGVVAEYGPAWRDTDHMSVPVVFKDGRMGLYKVSALTLLDSSKKVAQPSS